GALKHHVIDRDATLRRMLFGTATVTGLLAPHTRGPMVASFSLWIVVIAGGTALGWPDDQAAPTQELAAVESDWQVTDGTLGIAVTQFGSQVAGEFSDWTAEIAYDPDTGTGDVTVRINVGSLTLGSVTDNAKSADYLAAETFPFATFTGTITRREGDAHTAQGTLTLRGQDAPVTLDFDLVVEGDGATMAGSATIDRRDHNVGDVQPTESNLGFSVGVTVTLTATRGELGV
ncbi:MAG: YceI family protein, partial [Pseudomonadota bacterium]